MLLGAQLLPSVCNTTTSTRGALVAVSGAGDRPLPTVQASVQAASAAEHVPGLAVAQTGRRGSDAPGSLELAVQPYADGGTYQPPQTWLLKANT